MEAVLADLKIAMLYQQLSVSSLVQDPENGSVSG